MRFTSIIITYILLNTNVFAQENCSISNKNINANQSISYILSYNWFVIFSDVGYLNLKIENDRIFNKEAYRFTATGTSMEWWDPFFKVRDKYISWVDRNTLKPIYFQRHTHEGNYRQISSYKYLNDSMAYSRRRVNDGRLKEDTIKTPLCINDVMSSILYTRNLDYSNMKVGTKFPIQVLLDREIYDLHYTYIGDDEIKLRGLGTFNCMKFTVMLVEGTMFGEGDDMTMWVTKDKNLLPIYITTPIIIGKVKARATSIEGAPYPLTSKIR